jgi:hypothetical protein
VSQALTLYTTPVIYLAFDRPRAAACARRRDRSDPPVARRVMNLSAPFIRRPVRDDAPHHRLALRGVIGFRFLPVAALPQVDFPTIQVSAACRRRSRDDGDVGRGAARAAVRPHRRRHRDDLDELPRLDRRSSCSSTSTGTSTAPRATCRPPSMPRAATLPTTLPAQPDLSGR